MCACADPALSDDDLVEAPGARDELELRCAIDLERREVARIDADHVCVDRERAVELVRVVRLDERAEAELARVREKRSRTLCIEIPEDQEDGVGARQLELQ